MSDSLPQDTYWATLKGARCIAKTNKNGEVIIFALRDWLRDLNLSLPEKMAIFQTAINANFTELVISSVPVVLVWKVESTPVYWSEFGRAIAGRYDHYLVRIDGETVVDETVFVSI